MLARVAKNLSALGNRLSKTLSQPLVRRTSDFRKFQLYMQNIECLVKWVLTAYGFHKPIARASIANNDG
jgi:hypothetical protein